jgi:hypothetical protein
MRTNTLRTDLVKNFKTYTLTNSLKLEQIYIKMTEPAVKTL